MATDDVTKRISRPLVLILGASCRLKAAAVKLEEAIKSTAEEMEQYVKLLTDNYFV